MADIDLEAVNRLRASLGIKPIESGPTFREAGPDGDDEEPASTLETREAAAGDNWLKLKTEQEEKVRRKAQKESIRKAKEAAARTAKLTGTTLGDEDNSLDTTSWLRQQSKRQKKIEKARKLQEELDAREKQAEYTEKDLAGVKVGHQIGQFESGGEQILTLKDAEIGEESEEDELENLDLREQEKLKERLELKKKKPNYNPNEVDESGETRILAQYDEEIEGKKRQAFTLDSFGAMKDIKMANSGDGEKKSKGVIISLDILKDDKPISDYVDASEIKIKKPKKKKSKSTRKKDLDDDDIFQDAANSMEVDSGPLARESKPKKRSIDDANFVDDDDLQARLAQQRRDALKKRKRMRPEDLAQQLKYEEESAMDGVEEAEDFGLVIDETSEFVEHFHADDDEEDEKPTRVRQSKEEEVESEDDGDVKMESYADVKEETQDEDTQLENEETPATGLEEESTLDQGLGSTLAMLRQRRIIAEEDPKGVKNKNFVGYQRFLADKQKREDKFDKDAREQREADRKSGRLDRMSAREREEYSRQKNTHREQVESKQLAELFNKEYKPNVELKYVDEFGRDMNQKEAFKFLSHQFHGKGSGKMKHEKRLKKIEEEKKRESMNVIDSSQHTSSSAMGNKAKSNKQAGVRLQ